MRNSVKSSYLIVAAAAPALLFGQRPRGKFGAVWSPDGDGGGGGGDGGNGGNGGNGDGGNGGGGGDGGAHWSTTAGLAPEFAGHAFVKGSKDLGDFTRQAIEAQALIGRKGVIVPTEKSTAAEWDTYYNQNGRPEKADGYKVPERKGSDGKVIPYAEHETAFINAMLPSLHKSGLSQKSFDGLIEAYGEHNKLTEAAFTKYRDDATAALDKEWGDKKDAKLAAAGKFAAHVLGDQVENLKRIPVVGGGFLADNPVFLKLMAAAGEAMGEDTFVGGHRVEGDPFASPEAAQSYVDKEYADAEHDTKHWLNDEAHPDHRRLNDHMKKVMRYIAENKGQKK